MSWRVPGIVALGAVIGVAISMRSCSPQSVPGTSAGDRQSSSATQRETEPDGGSGAIPNEAIARGALDETAGTPAPQALPADAGTSVSGLERFVDLRGIPRAPFIESQLKEFAAQPRDPAWSTGMEAQFQSELSQSSLTLTERYVECRRSVCVVVLVRPPGTHQQEQQVGLLGRAALTEMSAVAQTLNLFAAPGGGLVLTRDGALVHWHRFQRKCGLEWQCLE
jgi:hypothetical protein